ITGGASPTARFAVPAGAKAGPGIHAGRNAQLDLRSELAPAGAAAGFARLLDHPPRPLAMRAGLGDAENPTRTHDLSAAAAGRTGFSLRSGFGSRAAAGIAALGLCDRDFLFASVGGFLEGDLHVVTEIVAPLRLCGIA